MFTIRVVVARHEETVPVKMFTPNPHAARPRAPVAACSCGAILLAKDGKFEAVGSGYVLDEAGAQQKFSRMGDKGVTDVDAIDVDD